MKVGITKRLDISEKVDIPVQQVAQQAMNENDKNTSKNGKEKNSYVLSVGPGGTHR